MRIFKIPESVLVVIHTMDLRVLLIERADHPGFWQSVTGSRHAPDEPLEETARRELFEETGIIANDGSGPELLNWNFSQTYEIYPHWRHRYAPGVTENIEHVFSVCVPHDTPIRLSSREPAFSGCLIVMQQSVVSRGAIRKRFASCPPDCVGNERAGCFNPAPD
jgi:dATP pyrophosphohydrolase